jgi:hypothetical protein
MTDDNPNIDTTGHRSSQRIRTRPGGRRRLGGDPASPRRRRPGRAVAVLATVGAVAVVTAGGTLAAATFGAGGEDAVGPGADPPSAPAMPSCVWVTQRDGPVVPPELFLSAPSADAMLLFEYCDAAWTGDMAWLGDRAELSTGGSDDGLPNPWEAGNRAVEQWLEGEGGQAPPGWRGP